MILTLVATLSLLVSIISAFLGRNVRPYIYVCIISLVLFFSIYFNLAPVEIAQDLDNYFAWYSNINFVENEGRTDFGFSLFLSILPDGLDKEVFSSILSTLTIASLYYLIKLNLSATSTNNLNIGLIIILILIDRVFLDMSLNTSRSTLSIIFFMTSILSKNNFLKLCFILLSASFHLYAFVALCLFAFITYLCEYLKVPLKVIFYCSLIYFSFKFLFSFYPLISLEILDILFSDNNEERVARAFSSNELASISLSQFSQIIFAIIVPFYFFSAWSNKNYIKNQYRKNFTLSLGLLISSTVLILYPELTLSFRFLAVPLIIFSTLLPYQILGFYVIFKIILFLFFIVF